MESENDEEDFFFHEDGGREVVKVAIYEDRAFWVYRNRLFTSEVTKDPDFETARPLDTSELTEEQMSEIFEILDELKQHNERD